MNLIPLQPTENSELGKIKNDLFTSQIDLERKDRELSAMTLQLISYQDKVEKFMVELKGCDNIKILKKSIRRFAKEVNHKNQTWSRFKIYFENVHPKLLDLIQATFPTLSENDLKMVSFIKMNLANKEIGEILNITERGVIQSQRRLKKKIGLSPDQKLRSFVHSI